jgi:serine/threonine protein kinase
MKSDFLKKGSISMVLGKTYYQDFLEPQEKKLLKVTNLELNQNELRYMDDISRIPNATQYYALSETIKFKIKESDPFYEKIQELMEDDVLPSLQKPSISCFFIDYAGDVELFEMVIKIQNAKRNLIWKTPTDILKLMKHIIEGVCYLHQHKICHLDLKLENIMMDTKRKTYRIVDFGFASQEPFQDFIKKPQGTPGYIPYYFEKVLVTEYFPKVKANDFIVSSVTNKIPCIENYMLVYQIDSYCLGRTFYSIWKIFLLRYQLGFCIFPSYRKNIKAMQKVDLILGYLLIDDVHQRLSIIDVYDRFWKAKKITQI